MVHFQTSCKNFKLLVLPIAIIPRLNPIEIPKSTKLKLLNVGALHAEPLTFRFFSCFRCGCCDWVALTGPGTTRSSTAAAKKIESRVK
jgi:hypothetical protein